MIWLWFALLTLGAVAILIWPVIRHANRKADQAEADQAVYRAQLNEVDRDLADGVLTDQEAETARLEIKRRLLAADRRTQDATKADTPALRMGAVAGMAVMVPFAALATYLAIGSPKLPGAPVAELRADALEHPEQADMNVLIEQLADRLRENPDSAEGWVLLARSLREVNRLDEAAAAYRRGLATGANDPMVLAELGEVLIAVNGGNVTPEAVSAFETVLRSDRVEPRARFYLGLARAQAGDARDAIAIWRDLTASASGDAPWLGMVRQQMGEIAMAAGVMPMQVTPRHPLDAPSAPPEVQDMARAEEASIPDADDEDFRPDVSALGGRFSRDQLEMIQEMVGGLEARMEFGEADYDGWMQLGRSYGVLGNTDKAADAYREAIALRPEDVPAHVQLADLLLRSVGSADAITSEITDLSEKILSLDNDNPDGLFISGLAAASAGNTDLARSRWLKLLDILPPGDSARDAVSARLAELPQ